MSARAATKPPAIEVEEHVDHRGDIQTVFRRKPTVGEMDQQPPRTQHFAQLQQQRHTGVRI